MGYITTPTCQSSSPTASGGLHHKIWVLLMPLLLMLTMPALTACVAPWAAGSHEPTPKPPAVLNPPIYPGGTDVSQTSEGEISPSTLSKNSVITITFRTRDQPDQVLDYYRGLLAGAGWTALPDHVSRPDAIYYDYGHGPLYFFYVEATRKESDSSTTVLMLINTSQIPG